MLQRYHQKQYVNLLRKEIRHHHYARDRILEETVQGFCSRCMWFAILVARSLMSAAAGNMSTLLHSFIVVFVGFGFDEYVCEGSAMMFWDKTNPKGGFLSLSSILLMTSCISDGGTHTWYRMDSGGALGVDLWWTPRLFMVADFSCLWEWCGAKSVKWTSVWESPVELCYTFC